MGILKTHVPSVGQISVDEIQITDLFDVDLSHYFSIDTDDTLNYTALKPKIGNLRIFDPDGAVDYKEFETDPASGSEILVTTCITDKSISKIDHNGTISGATATIDIIELDIDMAGLTIDDDGANAVSLLPIYINANLITPTNVGLSSFEGIWIVTPSTGEYNIETGVHIDAVKTDNDSNAICIDAGRQISGDITADRAFIGGTYSAWITQSVTNNSAGDFDISQPITSGCLHLGLSHNALTTVLTKTDPDTFSATALHIDIDALTNDANTKLDGAPRAIDIDYTFTETLGELRMAASDIVRISATIPNGLSSAGAFQFDMMEINADSVVLNDANITFNLVNLDASAITLTSFAEFHVMDIEIPALTGTSAGIYISEAGERTVSLITSEASLLLAGNTIETSNWFEIKPDTCTINAGNTITFQKIDLDNVTINDGATTPYIYGIHMDLSTMTETEVDGTVLIGQYIQTPTTRDNYTISYGLSIADAMANPAFSCAIDVAGSAVGKRYGIYMSGDDSTVARDWIHIEPFTSTISDDLVFNYIFIDTDKLIINDGANTPEMTGFFCDFTGMGLTEVDGTILRGGFIDMSDCVGFDIADGFTLHMPDTGRNVAINASIKGTASGRIEEGAYSFCDHFWGREALTVWETRVTTGAVGGAPTSTDLNGVYELLTGNVATNEESLDWNDIFTFQNTIRPTMEVRVNLAQVDNDTNVFIGLVNTNIAADFSENLGVGNEDLIGFQMSHSVYTDTNWQLHCQKDGVSTSDAGAAAGASTWVTLRFEFMTDTSVEWFIDGTSQGTVATNVPTDALQPIIYIMTDAGAAKSMDIDYVKLWQDRS